MELMKQSTKKISRATYVKTLRDRFEYDKTTGFLYHRYDKSILGSPSPTGTMRCTFMGEQVTVAQLVWIYHTGKAPVGKVMSLARNNLHTTVKGKRANCTKIEYLYDTGSHAKGFNAVDPTDADNLHNRARAAAATDTGITWQKSHKSFKVVIEGKYLGSRKTLDEARQLKDNYIQIKEHGNTRWFGDSHAATAPTPDQLKKTFSTDHFEYEGRQYRKHGGWNKFVFGVGDSEVRGTEDQIKRYIDALNHARDTGDTTNLFAVSQELASASGG